MAIREPIKGIFLTLRQNPRAPENRVHELLGPFLFPARHDSRGRGGISQRNTLHAAPTPNSVPKKFLSYHTMNPLYRQTVFLDF